ncbi:MAG: hypothetical protein ACRD2R_08560, partial [Terriglobales bacterium]
MATQVMSKLGDKKRQLWNRMRLRGRIPKEFVQWLEQSDKSFSLHSSAAQSASLGTDNRVEQFLSRVQELESVGALVNGNISGVSSDNPEIDFHKFDKHRILSMIVNGTSSKTLKLLNAHIRDVVINGHTCSIECSDAFIHSMTLY